VLTVYPRNHYAQVSGTSFSAPLVAGGAALLVDMAVQIDGTEASAALSHATYIGQELGAGELDLYQACLAVIKKN
jgi:subtilisin family serine protease